MRSMICVAMLLVVPATALAQQEAGGDTSMTVDAGESGLDQEARIVYEAGVVAYGEQRFENALEYFERAYELSGRPQMLFNIALAADRLRRDQRAVEAYQQYVDSIPDAENRAVVEERLGLLRREIAGRQRAEPSAHESSGPSIGGIVLLSIGGLALGGAVAGAVWWAGRADVLSQCDVRGCANVGVIEGERNAAIGVTVAAGVVGLAAITTGILLLAAGGSDDQDATATACGVSPFGVSCAGRF